MLRKARVKSGLRAFVTQGEVCADPQRPCVDVERFKANELSFVITY